MKTLLELYTSRLNDLMALTRSLPEAEDCDGPFLMDEPSTSYFESLHRVLIVGQETNGWHGGYAITNQADIIDCVETFKKFNFGEKYKNIFFPYFRRLGKNLAGSSEACMWTNLFKFGRKSGKGTASDLVNEAEIQYFNVLRDEIEILKPTCVVFLTGPNYDHFLQQRIPDATFQSMGEFNQRQLVKVASSCLPECAYRIYHPGYGNRNTGMYLGTIEALTTDYFSKN